MNLDSGRLVALNVETTDVARDKGLLDHEFYVCEFVETVVHDIGMTALTSTQTVRVPPTETNVDHPHADDGGLTAQCIISTSHVAYHSWPLQDRFRLVVDSCKDFSVDDVLAVVERFFPVKRFSVQNIEYASPDSEVRGERQGQTEAAC